MTFTRETPTRALKNTIKNTDSNKCTAEYQEYRMVCTHTHTPAPAGAGGRERERESERKNERGQPYCIFFFAGLNMFVFLY